MSGNNKTQQIEKTEEFVNAAQQPDKVIAKASDVCCLQGTLHTGEPRGTKTTIADVETYVVEPPQGKANGNILLYCKFH